MNPKVLLLDESLCSLDLKLKRQMQIELKKMYSYFIKQDMILSLDNITKQLYRNEFTINVLKENDITKPLTELGVFTEAEVESRHEIMLDSYSKTIQVEASTALKIAKNQIFPACLEYLNKMAEVSLNISKNEIDNTFIKDEVVELSNLIKTMKDSINVLEDSIKKAINTNDDVYHKALVWKDIVLVAMSNLRKIVDTLEMKVDTKYWPMPTYTDILFGVN